MIYTRFELQALEESVTRPILILVGYDIKKLLGVDKNIYTKYDIKDNLIISKNKLGNIKIDNTTKSEMMYIESTESSFEEHELALIPVRPDFRPIYTDKDIDAKFQPIHHPRRMTLRVKYLSRSKSKMFSVINRLRLYTANDGMYTQHDLIYHYSLPNYVSKLLIEINNLKNKRLDTALRLDEYISSTFDNRVDYANSLDGDIFKSDLIIRESQIGIEGWITDSLHDINPEYNEENAEWSLEFEYTFVYEKPISLLLKYPLVIYNTLIDKFFRNFQKEKRRSKNAYRTARSSDLYKVTEPDRNLTIRDDSYYLTVPEVDREKLPYPPAFYARMFTVLNIVNEEDPCELFNIQEIPRIKFREHVLKFILGSEFKHVSDKFNSLFYIDLYRNKEKDNNRVILHEDGTLRTEYPMDIKGTYRVAFNVLTDLNLLQGSSLKRVKNYLQEEVNENIISGEQSMQDIRESNIHNIHSNITQVDNGNMVSTYLNLISVDEKYVYKKIEEGTKLVDIPFTISDNRWLQMRTKQIQTVLAYAMESK